MSQATSHCLNFIYPPSVEWSGRENTESFIREKNNVLFSLPKNGREFFFFFLLLHMVAKKIKFIYPTSRVVAQTKFYFLTPKD